ncbi:DUF2975 domain-containing protein [Ningiella sp. W23]|uniref:DUF2975 domain-containing protein n=1 Tax=Ningiella sp. W23 TaxID=3023715 RepID=UPI003756F2F2
MTTEKMSKVISHLLLVPIALLFIMWIYFLINIGAFEDVARSNISYAINWDSVSEFQLYVAALLSLLPHLIIAWGLLHLRQLFQAFSEARVFDKDNAQSAKRFAKSLVFFWVCSWIVSVLVSLVLSWNHASGQKVLSIQFNSEHLAVLLLGLVFWVIAKVLLQAHYLEKENKAFV